MDSIGKIGVLLPEIVDPLDYELLRGIHTEAAANDLSAAAECNVPHDKASDRHTRLQKKYCITGFPEHRPSKARAAGYRQAMQESGLSCGEQDIFYGQFWREVPQQIGRQIAEGSLPMPDSIVCASDSMAAALCESLIANGISVPEQIAVTGFDGSADAWIHSPKLTTVIGRDLQLGADAVRRLCGMITGQELPPSAIEQEICCGESCGCTHAQTGTHTIDAYVLEHYFRHRIRHTVWHKQFYASDLINKMRNQNSLHGWIEAADQVGHVLRDWEWLEICLCEDWCFDLEHPELFRTEGYPDRMLNALSKRRGVNANEQYLFPTSAILPALQLPHEPKLLLLTSLHNRGQFFGFIAAAYDSPEKISADDFYLSWCEAAVNGLDNLQHIMHREYIKSQMELLTVRDPETGLYNRRGFAERLPEMLTEMRRTEQTPALLLITWQKSSGLLPFDPMLVLPNALRHTAEGKMLTMRTDDSVLAILYAEDRISVGELSDRIDSAVKSLLGKLSGTIQLVTNSVCISDFSLRESEQAVMQAAQALKKQAETAGIDLNAALRRLRQNILENPAGELEYHRHCFTALHQQESSAPALQAALRHQPDGRCHRSASYQSKAASGILRSPHTGNRTAVRLQQ